MPTYDYRCDACRHEFEELQPFSADPLKTCPKCGQDQLRRLFGTGAAVLFKGSGFYETDYKRAGEKKAESAESKPAESKPAESKPSPSANGAPGSGAGSTPAKSDGAAK